MDQRPNKIGFDNSFAVAIVNVVNFRTDVFEPRINLGINKRSRKLLKSELTELLIGCRSRVQPSAGVTLLANDNYFARKGNFQFCLDFTMNYHN